MDWRSGNAKCLYHSRSNDDQNIDTYVLPRTLTEDQTANLKRALSSNPSDVDVTVLFNVADQETTEYAGQIFNAIHFAGGWEQVQMDGVNPWNPEPVGGTKTKFNRNAPLVQGLAIWTCIPGQPTNPDPKHPPAYAILMDAFNASGIPTSGGMTADCGSYYVDIVVGKRPLTVTTQRRHKGPPTLLQRLGYWISSLGS